MELIYGQWIVLIGSSLLLFFLSPLAKTTDEFFKAIQQKKAPNAIVLTGSLIISWIFAKSITNAANLGLEFGILGGLAYACYYVSFAVAGIIIYQMRTKGNYVSIHEFLTHKFGKQAMVLFSILIIIRLFNEVWSNTMVIGSYFGTQGSWGYYISILVFTFLILAYSLKGGLSSSVFTDVIQMVLFSILLLIILWNVFSVKSFTITKVIHSSTWSFEFGLNLFFAALLQSFSYPFHDPVLTDRAFISSPKVTRKSFLWASFLGGLCIVLFGTIGVYAKFEGMSGDAAIAVGKAFGVLILVVINFIMITSAASTIDSTFSSFSKLIVIDLKWGKTVTFGRLSMIVLAVLGTIPVFLNAEILSATTISGTMIIGLTPVFLFWNMKVPRISFYLSVLTGLLFGFLLVFNWFPNELQFTNGKYADLLWVNVWGIITCIILYCLPKWIKK
ncbi:Sodium:solute symporter [Flavobacterium sp. 9AF]|uniref:sodium:solute symporter family transporter n=1 Tax=Flavobacterium sp. 9AF TaxID=2653142 RepID=UPI0012EFB8F9|nr:sodium:solute symporter [Flavobacterium sp. 9AF]VXA92786.1 Sodium:solute symporter [Flavobacterium sp. 9AF]